MKHLKQLTMTLLLLITAAAGAWAQTEELLVTINSNENTGFKSGSQTFDGKATVTFSDNLSNDGDNWGWYYTMDRTIAVTAADGYTVTRVKFYTQSSSASDEEAPFEARTTRYDTEYYSFVNGNSIGGVGVTKIEVYGYETPGPEVTISEAKSEASFAMPANDVTATYTLKRDMSVDMDVTVKDENENSRFRVQKMGNVFVPVGMNEAQIAALFNVHDDIEEQDLTASQDYLLLLFAADEEGQPTGARPRMSRRSPTPRATMWSKPLPWTAATTAARPPCRTCSRSTRVTSWR